MDAELSALIRENQNVVIQNLDEKPVESVPTSFTSKFTTGVKSSKNEKKGLTNLVAPLVRRKRNKNSAVENSEDTQKKMKLSPSDEKGQVTVAKTTSDNRVKEATPLETDGCLITANIGYKKLSDSSSTQKNDGECGQSSLPSLGGLVAYDSDCSSE